MTTALSYLDGFLARLADVADTPSINYFNCFIVANTAKIAFETFLDYRQRAAYRRPKPPTELADHMSMETFGKAQAYNTDKINFSIFKELTGWGIDLAIYYSNLMPITWNLAGKCLSALGLAPSRVIAQSMIWAGINIYVPMLITLPLGYYSTFVIEEKHGFNKSTLGLWIADQVKSAALVSVLGLPIFAGILKVIEWAGNSFVPYLMGFTLALTFAMQLIYPTLIQPLFNKLTPLPKGELRDRVEKLAGELNFPLKHLYVIDGSKRSSHSNAYFYGLPWSKHIVIFDTLIEKSTPAEVEAVLAHELGHWKYRHPTKLLAISQFHLFYTFSLLAVFLHNKSLYSSFGFDPRLATHSLTGGPQPIAIGFFLFQALFSPLDSIINFFNTALTRKYEYEADEFAVKLGKKEDLAKALIALHVDNLSSPHNDNLYSLYHHSHPTLPQRLRAMDAYGKQIEAVKGKKEL